MFNTIQINSSCVNMAYVSSIHYETYEQGYFLIVVNYAQGSRQLFPVQPDELSRVIERLRKLGWYQN